MMRVEGGRRSDEKEESEVQKSETERSIQKGQMNEESQQSVIRTRQYRCTFVGAAVVNFMDATQSTGCLSLFLNQETHNKG